MRIAALISVLVLGASGCIVEAPSSEKASSERSRAVVTAAPPLQLQLGANLEDKVELVGATIQPGRVLPGEAFRVTMYLKVLESLEADYSIFVHVDDSEGRSERLNADHKPAGGTYPTSQWKKGEIVKDEFMVNVPAGMPVRMLNLFVGFWNPADDSRLKLKNTDKVRNDGNNRILLAQVPVGT